MESNIKQIPFDTLVNNSMPFIIKTISNITHRYVNCENDDEFSIALIAFNEARQRYDETKGPFYPYAKLVIESRLKTYLTQQNSRNNESSLEQLEEVGIQFTELNKEDNPDFALIEEIELYSQELNYFGLNFDVLVDTSPKHCDTRASAFTIGKTIANDQPIVETTYTKRKLPVSDVARFMKVSLKIIKHSKHFILATMIIFHKQYTAILNWLSKARCAQHV